MEAVAAVAYKPKWSFLCLGPLDLDPWLPEVRTIDVRNLFPEFCISDFNLEERASNWLFKPLHQRKNTMCFNSDSDVNFRLTNSEKGGVDMHVGSSTIHVPKNLSVHHPVAKMMLFANHSTGFYGNEFSCPKSVTPERITSMVNRQPSSASPNVYEAGWVPSWKARKYDSDPEEIVDIKGSPSFSVLFEDSTNEVTASNVSSVQRASVSVTADEAQTKPVLAAPGAQDSVNIVLDSGSSVLPTEISLHQHYVLNDQIDESSGKPRSNSAPTINPSYETARTPVAHKCTDEDSEHHSNPNPCLAERGGIVQKTGTSNTWYIATGAAHHATGNSQLFSILEVEECDDLCVHAADGTPMPVCGRGNVATENVILSDVWYVPGLDVNLVSVGQLAELDYSIGFARGSCTISSAADTVVGRAHVGGDGLYEVDFLQVPLGMP